MKECIIKKLFPKTYELIRLNGYEKGYNEGYYLGYKFGYGNGKMNGYFEGLKNSKAKGVFINGDGITIINEGSFQVALNDNVKSK